MATEVLSDRVNASASKIASMLIRTLYFLSIRVDGLEFRSEAVTPRSQFQLHQKCKHCHRPGGGAVVIVNLALTRVGRGTGNGEIFPVRAERGMDCVNKQIWTSVAVRAPWRAV
jgi:hypothetical protein